MYVKKSRLTSLVLTLIFGPLGIFYSSGFAALAMLIITIVTAVVTAGVGLLVVWPLCVAIGDHSTHKHNENRKAFLAAMGRVD